MPDATTTAGSPRIGFIGTGLIGTPMVQRLLECGLSVTVWNRTPDKAAPLVQDGASLAESPRALAESCDIVCLCLTNTTAVHDVVFGAQGIDAVLRVGQCQHAQYTWRSYGAPTHNSLFKRHGFAVALKKERGCDPRWSGLSTVKGLGFFAIKVQQKSTAA